MKEENVRLLKLLEGGEEELTLIVLALKENQSPLWVSEEEYEFPMNEAE